MNILFLGASKRRELVSKFKYALSSLSRSYHIFSVEDSESFHSIKSLGVEIVNGPPFEDGYAYFIDYLIKDKKIDLVVPCMDRASVEAARLNGGKFGLSPLSLYEKCLDKSRYSEFKGVEPIPKTKPPYYIKKRDGYGNRCGIISDGSDLELYSDDYVVQDYLKDWLEFSIDCFVKKNGEFTYYARTRDEISDGEVVRSTWTPITSKLLSSLSKLIANEDFYGPVNIQYIINPKNPDEFYLMDVNPRFGGGSVMAITAGINMPDYMILDVQNKFYDLPQQNHLKKMKMCRTRQSFYEEIT